MRVSTKPMAVVIAVAAIGTTVGCGGGDGLSTSTSQRSAPSPASASPSVLPEGAWTALDRGMISAVRSKELADEYNAAGNAQDVPRYIAAAKELAVEHRNEADRLAAIDVPPAMQPLVSDLIAASIGIAAGADDAVRLAEAGEDVVHVHVRMLDASVQRAAAIKQLKARFGN